MRTAAKDRTRLGPHGRVLATLAAAAVAATVPTLAGHAAITVEPEQTWETGTITKVDDGDTVFVDVRTASQPAVIAPAVGQTLCADRVDPVTGAMPSDATGPVLHDCRVRIIGIQTAERSGTEGSIAGQCSAHEAKVALTDILPIGTQVQLRSIRVTSAERQYQGGRMARSVYYEPSPGSGIWVDASRALLQAGLAMWMPLNVNDAEKPEYTHNLEYRQLADTAAAAGVGLFSGHLCAPTGTLAANLRMYVVSDPPGDDAGREYVVINNDSDTPVDLSGWTLRDSSFTYARFAPGVTIPARDYLRVYGGVGTPGVPTSHDYYFNSSGAMFANYTADAGYFFGDAAYLYAPDTTLSALEYGDLRAWYHYPCQGSTCTDPAVGKLVFATIMYDPPGSDTAAGEYVDIANPTAAPIRLGGYQFRRQNTTLQFAPEAILAPGATMRISMGVGTDSPSTIYLGRTASLLTNTGDVLLLENVNSAAVDCRAWGTMSCPPGVPVSGTVPSPTPSPSATVTPTPVQPIPSASPVARTVPRTTNAIVKPSAPRGVSASASKKRLQISWSAPVTSGTYALTKYRARAYLRSGGKLKWRATCYAKATKLTCKTKKLKKSKIYYVKVWAKNKKGYGTASAPVAVRNK